MVVKIIGCERKRAAETKFMRLDLAKVLGYLFEVGQNRGNFPLRNFSVNISSITCLFRKLN